MLGCNRPYIQGFKVLNIQRSCQSRTVRQTVNMFEVIVKRNSCRSKIQACRRFIPTSNLVSLKERERERERGRRRSTKRILCFFPTQNIERNICWIFWPAFGCGRTQNSLGYFQTFSFFSNVFLLCSTEKQTKMWYVMRPVLSSAVHWYRKREYITP